MTIQSKLEALDYFGKRLIHFRDLTIEQSFQTVKGEMKSKKRQELYRHLSDLDEKQKKAVYDLIVDVTDSAFNNFLWLFEQEEEIMINVMIEDKPVNINDISDGLCVDYLNFVDDFSEQKKP